MARPVSTPKTSRFVLLASVCVVVAALYFAQQVLIPVALSVLLTFLLTPAVQKLEDFRLNRVAAVLIVVTLAFGAIGGLGWLVVDQVITLARDLPTYKGNIKSKLNWLPKPGEHGVLNQLRQTVTELNQEMSHPSTTQSTQPTTGPAAAAKVIAPIAGALPDITTPPIVSPPPLPARGLTRPTPATRPDDPVAPIPVTVVPPEPGPLELVQENIGAVAGPLGTAGIVAVFVIFMLLAREDLRNRLVRLVGYGQLTLTTQALDDAASRISRYLMAQAIVNGSYGAGISLGLWIIGRTVGHGNPPFPNVLLWGMLCAVLRFIPYIGPWIASAFPVLLSLAVYQGFGVFVATVSMFVVIEMISNNVMEPMLYGASTGMSTIAILVSAVFWTWLWGTIGLVLATPLTVCLIVLGKYVPQLQFLDILLGDEPVLAPHERLFQRWLALDQEEAADLIHEFFADRSLEAMYDDVLLPALAMAEQDRHGGRLDDRRQQMILQSSRELIDELGDEYRLRFAKTGAGTADAPAEKGKRADDAAAARQATRVALTKSCVVNVLVLPAHDEADEIVGLMLAQVLGFNNYCSKVVPAETLAGEMIGMVDSEKADAVCVSALPPAAVTHARYLCKRLYQRYSDLKLVVGLWTVKGDLKRAKDRITAEGAVRLVTSVADALNQIEQVAHDVVVQRESKPADAPADASSQAGSPPDPNPASSNSAAPTNT